MLRKFNTRVEVDMGGGGGESTLVLKHSPSQPRQHTGFNRHLAEQTALAPPLFSQETLICCLSYLQQLCGHGFIKVGVAQKIFCILCMRLFTLALPLN